jgi:hypothetical protein
MSAYNLAGTGDEPRTEERLRTVTALCVESLIGKGMDPRTIRPTVLRIATQVIRSLASDHYEEETHTAVVQRTIEECLSRASLTA